MGNCLILNKSSSSFKVNVIRNWIGRWQGQTLTRSFTATRKCIVIWVSGSFSRQYYVTIPEGTTTGGTILYSTGVGERWTTGDGSEATAGYIRTDIVYLPKGSTYNNSWTAGMAYPLGSELFVEIYS